MRARILAAAVVAAGAVPLFAVPAQAGTGYGQLIVTPSSAAPGQTVSLLGTCPNNGSALTGLVSSAFVGGAAVITSGGSFQFHGTAVIASSAGGTYTVKAVCGAGSPSTTITVTGSAVPTSTSSAPATMPTQTSMTTAPTVTAGGGIPTTTPPWRRSDEPTYRHTGSSTHTDVSTPSRNPRGGAVMSTPTTTMSTPSGAAPVATVDTRLTASAASSNTPLWLGAGAFLVASAGLGVLLTRRRIRRPTGR